MLSIRALLPTSFLLISACGASPSASKLHEAWNPDNDPLRMGGAYERSFASLPLAARVNTQPWSDTYWPSFRGGIANRWQTNDNPFSYQPPTAAEASAMTPAQLARLSPAEKYDIYSGRFDYPTVQEERQRTSPNNATWEGICHGWAPASLAFAEPHAVLVTGQTGIAVPFGASDVKALLSYYQGQVSDAPAENVGDRCDADLNADPAAANTPACRDTNAGAFHVVLANQLGLLGTGFVADVSRATQVWNQPVYAFKSKVVRTQAPSPGAAPGTVSESVIHTEMTYSQEMAAAWAPTNGTLQHADGVKSYDYRVELNANGEIIGGEWLEFDRPDFLWEQSKATFTGYFAGVADIAQQAATGPSIIEP